MNTNILTVMSINMCMNMNTPMMEKNINMNMSTYMPMNTSMSISMNILTKAHPRPMSMNIKEIMDSMIMSIQAMRKRHIRTSTD